MREARYRPLRRASAGWRPHEGGWSVLVLAQQEERGVSFVTKKVEPADTESHRPPLTVRAATVITVCLLQILDSAVGTESAFDLAVWPTR